MGWIFKNKTKSKKCLKKFSHSAQAIAKNLSIENLAKFTANQVPNAEVHLVDLNNFEMPIYGIDKENAMGIPELAHKFKKLIKNCDGIIISFAEHNGAYSTAFKNIFDWISRIEKDVWADKPMFLLATSPGARGGQTVLDIAVNKFIYMNENSIVNFSLPSFHQNFSEEDGITDDSLKNGFEERLNIFIKNL